MDPVTHQVSLVPLADLRPSRHQNRTFAAEPDDALRGLAESILAQGVIEPVICRPVEDGDTRYELVAGERRWRASRLAEQRYIPAIVRDLDDEAAAEITVTENLQREDLSPMEEAAGVQTMLRLHRGDARIVADRLRVPPSWVARRARLAELVPAWREAALDRESVVSHWSAAQLEVIARVAPAHQEHLTEELLRWRTPVNPTVRELEGIVARGLRILDAAPWDRDDNDLLPDRPACSDCPDRTSRQPLLFEELEAEEGGGKDRCTNAPCWARKAARHVERLVRDLPPEAIRVRSRDHHYHRTGEVPDHVKTARDDWEVEKKSKKAGGVLCLVVDGPDAGRTYYGAVRPSWQSAAAKKKGGPKPLAERRAALEARRWKRASERIQEELDAAPPPELAVLTRLAASVGTCLELAGVYDSHGEHGWGGWPGTESALPLPVLERRAKDAGIESLAWARYDLYAEEGGAELAQDLWSQVLPVLRSRCQYAPDRVDRLRVECERAGEIAGIDVAAIYAEAVEALPEPKGWDSLRADGTPKKRRKAKKAAAAA